MATEELQKEIEEQRAKKRKPIFDVTNNREEIRTIAMNTIAYAKKLYPSMASISSKIWEIVPRSVVTVMEEYIKYLDQKKSGKKSISCKIGEFMTLSIESAILDNSEKAGTLNPMIEVGPELTYYNDDPKKNKLPSTPPVLEPEDQTLFDRICLDARNRMGKEYGIQFEEYQAVGYVFLAFMRQVKQYLIEHKDDEDYGIDLFIGTVMDIGIERYLRDDNPTYDIVANRNVKHEDVNYHIQVSGAQSFKIAAKDDDKTEEHANDQQ